MKGRHVLLAVPLLSTLLITNPSHAWQPVDDAEPTWSGIVPYTLNEAGSEDLGGLDGTEDIVRQGFDDWARVSCTSLKTEYEGSTTNEPLVSGSYVVGWIETDWPYSPSAIGVTAPNWNGDAEIIDAHMAMNGENFVWSTDPGEGARVHAYSIVLHEAGHYFGLGHSADADATMYASYSGGVEELNPDDEEGICALYAGGGGGPVTDCTETGCPDGEECVDGECQPAEEPGAGICAPCDGDGDCGRAEDLCLMYPDGSQYCGKSCTDDSDCSSGSCEEVSSGTMQCVQRNSAGDPSCEEDGGEDDGTSDDGGGDPSGGDDTVSPDDATSGGEVSDMGESCTTNDDCVTDVCARDETAGYNFCTDLCDTKDDCPSSYACVDAGGGNKVCQPGSDDLGSGCDSPEDCESGICASTPDGEQFCTRDCSSESSCPQDFECIGATDADRQVCVGRKAAPAESGVIVGGCSATRGSGPSGAAWLGGLLVALLLARRRREH